MKKITLLTSVLALAACGGGSGGGSAVPTVDFNIPVQELANATFKSDGDKVTFGVNGDSINSVTFYDNEEIDAIVHIKPNSKDVEKITVFEEGQEYELAVTQGTLEMFGKQKGLKHTDFGYVDAIVQENGQDEHIRSYIIGGFNSKHIERPEATKTFHGDAYATVYSDRYSVEKDEYTTKESYISTNNANLTVNLEEDHYLLSADFTQSENPWYKVTIDDKGDLNLEGNVAVDKEYQVNNMEQDFYGNVSSGFFGEKGVATEVVSEFYGIGMTGEDENHHITIDGIFGGVAK